MTPQTSKTETGPSSGSSLSFVTELIKHLSPIISSRTTREVDGLKSKANLTILKRVVRNLLDGKNAVLDCGRGGEAGIPVQALGWTHNKRGKPRLDPQIRFHVDGVVKTQMEAAAYLAAPLTQLEAPDLYMCDVTIRILKGTDMIGHFAIEQCLFNMPKSGVFVSLEALEKNPLKHLQWQAPLLFVADNFTLVVHTGFDGYIFALKSNDTGECISPGTEVPYAVFEPVPKP